jgi:tocopherol O-methyltransferase
VIASREEITGDAIASHYDELDYFYRDVWGEHVHHGLWRRGDESRDEAVRALVQLAAREARIDAGARVCDIGCGYGATARMLAEEMGAHVTGITLSPAQFAFAEARRGGAENVRFILGDWLHNDLADASFDAAVALESSEHMDKAGFFAQAHRVLRPGGRLVVCAWLSREAPAAWQQRWLLEPICREGRFPHLGTASDYERLALAAGFAIERVEDVSAEVAPTWSAVARTFIAKLLRAPAYARYLFSRNARNRIFALTVFRILIAYRTGTMRYAVFTLLR